MMRIDAHQHFWRYAAEAYPWIGDDMPALKRDRLPQDLEPALAAAHIDACIAVQARADEAENVFLLELADAHPWIVAVVGWIDLFSNDASARLDHWSAHPKFRGVRHLLQDDPDVAATLADPRFNAGVDELQRRRLVYDILVRGPLQLAAAVPFCARHDRHWLVLDHLGKPSIAAAIDADWHEAIRALGALPHVLCKVSGLVTELTTPAIDAAAIHRHLDVVLEAFGAERLMFGSDWPVCELRADYAEVAAIVRDWAGRLSAHEQAQLWGSSAARCYGFTA